jgi:hypothetical protein
LKSEAEIALIRQRAQERALVSGYFRRPNPEMDKVEQRLEEWREKYSDVPTADYWVNFVNRHYKWRRQNA